MLENMRFFPVRAWAQGSRLVVFVPDTCRMPGGGLTFHACGRRLLHVTGRWSRRNDDLKKRPFSHAFLRIFCPLGPLWRVNTRIAAYLRIFLRFLRIVCFFTVYYGLARFRRQSRTMAQSGV